MLSRAEPISSSSSSSSTSPPNDSFSLSKLLEESKVKKIREGGREGGRQVKRKEGLKQYFHRGYYQIGQGTVYTKLHVGQSKL